jgi:hypothetical protein
MRKWEIYSQKGCCYVQKREKRLVEEEEDVELLLVNPGIRHSATEGFRVKVCRSGGRQRSMEGGSRVVASLT